MFENKASRILAMIVGGGFLFSVAYSFYFRIPPMVDARAYDTIAWNVASGRGYREVLGIALVNDWVIARVGPGYELFLAGFYKIFGHHLQIIWVAQAVLHALSALLVFLISKKIFRATAAPTIGLIAAALVALSPDQITISAMLLTETLGIFLLLATILAGYGYLEKPNFWRVTIFVAIFFLAVMVRTPTIFLLAPIGALFIWKKYWRHAIYFAVALVILFAPWTIRNYQLYGVFLPTNVSAGLNLLMGNYLGASGEQESDNVVIAILLKQNSNIIDTDKTARQMAIQTIIHAPGTFVLRTLHRASIYFSLARPTGFWFHLVGWPRLLTIITSTLWTAILFLGAAIGIGSWLKNAATDRKRVLLLLGYAFVLPLSIIAIVVETRYRMPIYPLLAIFAGYGFYLLAKKRVSWQPTLILMGVLLLNTISDVGTNIQRIVEHLHGLI